MIHKQGEEYKDDSAVEEAVLEDEESRKKFPPWMIGGGVVGGILLIALLIIGVKGFLTKEPEETFEEIPGYTVGDDEYWSQFDDITEPPFAYTAEQIQDLRAWGYTGTEIESYEMEAKSADELIEESRRLQEEARATLSNPESPEYQALLNTTWIGQNTITIPPYNEGVTEGQIWYNTHTLNADYDKVPAHGYNLFLKVYLNDTDYVFMECPLLRYMQLPESGNIVVTYQTATLDGSMIVHSMREVAVG